MYSYSFTSEMLQPYDAVCYQQVSPRYFTIYLPQEAIRSIMTDRFNYLIYPKLYTPMSTSALEVSGITRLSNQPSLNLKGQGVIIGIVDSGIDYTHPAFLDAYGKTRIISIWDQTIDDGPPPDGIIYGTEYQEEQINAALAQPDPRQFVKTTDPLGHGTFLAGVAGGSGNDVYDFIGAAPEAKFVIVKLKPARPFLRNYYFAQPDLPCFQENDIMLGLTYIHTTALKMGLPLSIPFGLGNSLGSHSGLSPLDSVINAMSYEPGTCICVPTGNEGLTARHYRGTVENNNSPNMMEIYISKNTPGITFEIWGQSPAILSIGLTSPTGEQIPRIPARIGQVEEINLIFEQTRIFVYYEVAEFMLGNEVIFVRMENPTEGIWQIKIYSNLSQSTFDAYLPASNLIGDRAYFLKPDPNITLTDPSSSTGAITISGFDPITGAFYQDSGRGFTRLGAYKPDICAPCSNITGPDTKGGYENRSGTSLAAALTAGACAQFLTWAVTDGHYPFITSGNIRTYLIRGAIRNPSISYPSVQWGYGTLDVYNSFEVLRQGGIS